MSYRGCPIVPYLQWRYPDRMKSLFGSRISRRQTIMNSSEGSGSRAMLILFEFGGIQPPIYAIEKAVHLGIVIIFEGIGIGM